MRARILVRGVLPAAALLVAAGGLAAQDDSAEWLRHCRDNHGWGRGSGYCEVRESNMPAGGTLNVDARDNGGVRVLGWDRNEVHVEARVQARAGSDAEARALAGRVRITTAGGTIRADGPHVEGRDRGWSVSYIVRVPRRSDLTVRTLNGPIGVERVSGRMDLSAVNGPLSLSEVGGDVRGRTENGPLRVSLSGARWQGTGLDVRTTNGPVVLTVPESYAAHLDVGNTNGPMALDFPVTVSGRIGHHIVTDLNGGGPTIRAMTVNGPIAVKRP
ncbi:MAG: hypothetical protein JWM27_402 [Gemmatimonadetes bacterium]|nr:hypothetical protein [Gemmatimonadota bacterium]